MTTQELLQEPAVIEQAKLYAANKVDFAPVLERAVAKATRQEPNALKREVVQYVIRLLAKELQARLAAKPARTVAGKIFRWVISKLNL